MLSSSRRSRIAESGIKVFSASGTVERAESRAFEKPQGETAIVLPLAIALSMCDFRAERFGAFGAAGIGALSDSETGSGAGKSFFLGTNRSKNAPKLPAKAELSLSSSRGRRIIRPLPYSFANPEYKPS